MAEAAHNVNHSMKQTVNMPSSPEKVVHFCSNRARKPSIMLRVNAQPTPMVRLGHAWTRVMSQTYSYMTKYERHRFSVSG